eukprot:TRINITY_DN6656_c0_g1_i1.p1 TRINITY_DN6656_c0_g1~~TRINITY_DN6656_c0_g1_i1.p1  ORF type:complete len:107 (-),score=20.32 TRINITY_DN6656_c0_g1_i1:124-444(-)
MSSDDLNKTQEEIEEVSENQDHFWGKFLAVTKTCETVHFDKDVVVFGRGSKSDVKLDHPGISGLHCKVWKEAIPGMDKFTVWIEDHRYGAWIEVSFQLFSALMVHT